MGFSIGVVIMMLSWKELIIIDVIYALQFVLFMQWYYPKVIIVTGYVPSFMLFEHITALLQLITCYILTVYNLKKVSKE